MLLILPTAVMGVATARVLKMSVKRLYTRQKRSYFGELSIDKFTNKPAGRVVYVRD